MTLSLFFICTQIVIIHSFIQNNKNKPLRSTSFVTHTTFFFYIASFLITEDTWFVKCQLLASLVHHRGITTKNVLLGREMTAECKWSRWRVTEWFYWSICYCCCWLKDEKKMRRQYHVDGLCLWLSGLALDVNNNNNNNNNNKWMNEMNKID